MYTVLEEPLSYDEIVEQMEANDGQVIAYVEIDYTFYTLLYAANEMELDGYCDAGEELYEKLAEMVIGNQWCYNSLYWELPEDVDVNASKYFPIKVIIEPDLDD